MVATVVCRILSSAHTNSDSVSSRKQGRAVRKTNTASTMKRNVLRREFMRNSTYSVIEV